MCAGWQTAVLRTRDAVLFSIEAAQSLERLNEDAYCSVKDVVTEYLHPLKQNLEVNMRWPRVM